MQTDWRAEKLKTPDSVRRRCDNPACDERFSWTGERGQPRRYCDDKCKKRAARALTKLRDEARAIASKLENERPGTEEAAPLKRRLAQVHWLIESYPLTAVPKAERFLLEALDLEYEYPRFSTSNFVRQTIRQYRDGASIPEIAARIDSDAIESMAIDGRLVRLD